MAVPFNLAHPCSAQKYIFGFDLDGTLRDSNQHFPEEIEHVLHTLMFSLNYTIHAFTTRMRQEIEGKLNPKLLEKMFFHGCYGQQLWTPNEGYVYQPENFHYPNFIKEILQEAQKQVPANMVSGAHLVENRPCMLAYTFTGLTATKTQRQAFIKFDNKTNFRIKVRRLIIDAAHKKDLGTTFNVEAHGNTSLDISDIPLTKAYAIENLYLLKESRKIVFFGDGITGGNDEGLVKQLQIQNVLAKRSGNTEAKHHWVAVKNWEDTLSILNNSLRTA